MTQSGTLKSLFDRDHSARQGILARARLCAELSKPWVLPPESQDPNASLPENYQSLGSRGTMNLEGRMLMALFPPSTPWFQRVLAPEIQYSPEIPDEIKQAIAQRLFLQDLMVLSVLESANLQPKRQGRTTGFRSRKRAAITQLLITGDVLEYIDDNYRLRTYRRDQYVTKRDGVGDVLYHVIKEWIDPLGLSDEMLIAAELKRDELALKNVNERMEDVFTRIEWQPESKQWFIEQELNGQTINESEEQISPFFSTPFELVAGENYGRGFIELNLGDLRSYENLRVAMLDFGATHSKQLNAIDYGSMVRERDLTKPSGSIFRAKVRGRKVDDVAAYGPHNAVNFEVVRATAADIRADLGAAMLLEAETQPKGERVTAYQVQRVAMELEGALGGVYAPIAEEQQLPLLRRVMWMMQKDNLLPALPEDAVEIQVLTGLAALKREFDKANLLQFAQVMGQFGPAALRRVNIGVMMNVFARYQNISEPGLIRSDEEIAAEDAQMAQQRLQEQAGGKAIDVVGDAAGAAMTPTEG